MSNHHDPIYTMGRSESETQRLIDQARIYDTNTRRLFEEVGLAPGMKVLDVGTGAGDLALMAARMVGPTGEVVGVDQNPVVLETARRRAGDLGLTNVRFVESDLRSPDLPGDFDGAVGRLVLLYTSDPAASIAAVASRVRPGGFIGFQELEFLLLTEHAKAFPALRLYGQYSDWMIEVFRKSGAHVSLGLELHSLFLKAGLPAPNSWTYAPMGGPRDWPGFHYAAETFRSLQPLMEQLAVIQPGEMSLEGLEAQMAAEVEEAGAPYQLGTHVTTWSRKPR